MDFKFLVPINLSFISMVHGIFEVLMYIKYEPKSPRPTLVPLAGPTETSWGPLWLYLQFSSDFSCYHFFFFLNCYVSIYSISEAGRERNPICWSTPQTPTGGVSPGQRQGARKCIQVASIEGRDSRSSLGHLCHLLLVHISRKQLLEVELGLEVQAQ